MTELDLFEAAIATADPMQRAALLDRECAGKPELRARLEELLAAHGRSNPLLDQPFAVNTIDSPGEAIKADDALHLEITGAVIAGRYKLLQQIGEGGMGTVWMADQTEPVKRRVAIKLIRVERGQSKTILTRFEAERQAIALMDHPHIARLLDAGTAEGGRPFFVMELVKGVPLTDFCDAHRLGIPERLHLFLQVCSAVQHAHQKGVIHRDLKPSNILVESHDGTPVPKIIDFGLAKATTGLQLTEHTLFTAFGSVMGTPLYMAPEQANFSALDVDTRTDIYALGIILYELLTGTTPITRETLKKAPLDEMLKLIREQEVPTPSSRLSSTESAPSVAANRHMEPAKLTKLVRGDLDWIVMKALEKDRGRRYETANGFARDIQRYLADEPVEACPPSAGYRLRKFARRNKGRLAVAGLVLFFLVLLGSGVGWVVRDRSARVADAVRQQEERQARVAGQVESIFTDVDRLEKEQKWSEALEAARRAKAAVAGGEADPATTERVRQRLRDLEFIDRLEYVRMLREAWVIRSFDNAGANRDYARAFRDYGVDVDELPVETSIDRLKARPALAVVLAAALDHWVFVRRFVSEADIARWKRLVAVARGIDPEPLRDRVRAAWGQPVANVRDDLRRLAESIDVRAQHPATLLILAHTLQRVELPDAALRILRAAQYAHPGDFWLNLVLGTVLADQKDHEGALRFKTAAVAIRPRSSAAQCNLGNALLQQKKLDEALGVFHKAIELEPTNSRAYNGLGNALYTQKKLDEAIACYRKAIELDPKYATAYNGLGNALHYQKKLPEAIDAFHKAIELEPKYAFPHYNLGLTLIEQRKVPAAKDAFKKAIELDPKDAGAYGQLGSLSADSKDYAKAIEYFRKVLDIEPDSAKAHLNLGTVLMEQKKLNEAVACFGKAIEIDPKYVGAYYNLGLALVAQNKLDKAIAAYHRAIELDPTHAVAHCNLGYALRRQNNLDEAIVWFRKAIHVDPKCFLAHVNLGTALILQKKRDEAIACYRAAIAIDAKDAAAHSGCRNSSDFAARYLLLGNVLLQQKNLDEAIACCRKAIELDEKLVRAYVSLGALLCDHLRDYPKAEACFRKAIQLGSKSAITHYNLGTTLYHQKKLDEAVAEYRKAIELNPKSSAAYNSLGNALGNQKKLDEAITAYRKAIEINPKSAPAHIGLGNALYLQKRLDEAVAEYRKAIELNPKSAIYHSNLGAALRDQGKLDEAVAEHRKAIELDPRYAGAYNNLGAALRDQGKLDEAVAEHRKAVELDPGNAQLHYNLGLALRDQGKLDEAIAIFQELLRLKPDYAQTLNDLAWRLATAAERKNRDGRQAVALARLAVKAAPADGNFWNTLGAAHYSAGNWKEAVATLEKSMQLRKGGDSSDWFFLAMAHWQLGEKDKARKWFDQAVGWMDKNQPKNEELRRFRAEASQLLELKEKK